MQIVTAKRKDAALLASLVSQANRDVAELLHLNLSNAPRHPSFCTFEWIISDFDRGQDYFLSTKNGEVTGCVAFEQADDDIAYLNRLSVPPKFRQKGTGSFLVQHIIDYSKSKHVKKISIGIIAEHTQLKEWYFKIGFIEGAMQTFDHLPFNVLYMTYEI